MVSTNRSSVGVLAGILIMAAGATEAGSASPPPPRAAAVQAVIDCKDIADGVQRLACFDKAVAAMSQAEAKGDLLTIDREQRRAVRRQAFGLVLPSFAIFDRGEKPEEADRLSAKVKSAYQTPTGKWVIELDDGALWRQIDDNELDNSPHPGSTADIRRAMLGSFFMNVDGQQAIRVHRDN